MLSLILSKFTEENISSDNDLSFSEDKVKPHRYIWGRNNYASCCIFSVKDKVEKDKNENEHNNNRKKLLTIRLGSRIEDATADRYVTWLKNTNRVERINIVPFEIEDVPGIHCLPASIRHEFDLFRVVIFLQVPPDHLCQPFLVTGLSR